MKKYFALMTVLCVPFLVAANCQTTALTEPCDVLVAINPAPTTNSYLVANDRPTAIAIAQHRGRYQKYECAE